MICLRGDIFSISKNSYFYISISNYNEDEIYSLVELSDRRLTKSRILNEFCTLEEHIDCSLLSDYEFTTLTKETLLFLYPKLEKFYNKTNTKL